MRLSQLCLWTSWALALYCSGLQPDGHPQQRGELERSPAGWRRQSTGAPPLLGSSKPAPPRGSGEKPGGRRRAAPRGPRVCGDRCCAGWTLSPKTRRCTKPRCSPPCRNGSQCRRFNRCVCRRGFHGYRCQLSMVTLSAPGCPLTSFYPTEFPVHLRPLWAPPQPALSPQRTTKPAASSPEPEPSDPTPTSAQADEEEDTKSPGPGSAKPGGSGTQSDGVHKATAEGGGGVSKQFLTLEENQTSPKTPSSIWLNPDPDGLTASNQKSDPGSKAEERRLDSFETSQLEFGPGLEEEEDHKGGKARREEKERTEETKEKKAEGAKKLSLREAQAVLLRKSLSQGGRGDKMAALLMKHIERERKKLHTAASPFKTSSSFLVQTNVKTFHTQKGQYSVHFSVPTADGQTGGGGGAKGGGGGVETIQVMFTPTICKVRCSQDRCINYCERGNVTTVYSSGEGGGRRDGPHGPGFRVFLCPLLCKNGGVCLQKNRCLCPPSFTGKFCQIPVTPTDSTAASASSTNEIVKPVLSAMAANGEVTHSEFVLPLERDPERAGAPSGPMVKVRVQHPPEASVKVHQVKMSGLPPTLRTLSSSSSGSAGAPAPAASGVQAQTVRGDGIYNQQSGFKYCFREVKDGQCSSPLPGLRSREMCCKGIGKAWGISDCVLCPDNTGQSDASCPVGFERTNGTQCVDVNECLQPGLCENGICVNTRGSYSCVCRLGFILDASHGICISQSVISEEKGQCYRILGSGLGPSSCSLPILKSITKQICCCSRVGKAWGPNCQRCPYFGSVAFKEICPAGPGFQYSPSTLTFNQIANEQLGSQGAVLVNRSNEDNQDPDFGSRSQLKPPSSGGASTSSAVAAGTRPSLPQPQPRPGTGFPASSSSSSSSRPVQPGSAGTTDTQGRTRAPQSRPDSTQPKPQPPSSRSQAGDRFSLVYRVDEPASRGDSLPAPAQPHSTERGSRPGGELPPVETRPAVSPTPQPTRVQTVRGVCESRPGVCGRGRCVDQPGGKHSCVCDQGFQLSSQRTHCQDVNECLQSPVVCSVGECVNSVGSYRCACPPGYRSNNQQTSCQDIDECRQNPCTNGRCDNTAGSYRCVCRLGYRLLGNTCTDVDECADPLRCPGQECVNTQGSYRCVSCPPGYGLLNGVCTDIDECRQTPCSNGRCENTPGSYRCVCHHGYKLQNNTCTDVDECAEPSQCPGQMCVNSVGSYRCVSCRPGFRLTNRQCTDINECENSDSCPGQRCMNTEGSYRCVDCRQGYHSVDGVCKDIDECASSRACEAERVCVNTVGSFRCECLPGYQTYGLGRQCRDINECLEGDFCFSRGECVNTPGSYMCVCAQGFTLSENRTACLDVDECVKVGVCSDGRCVNTEGSFQCECQIGFTTNPEGTACLDVDECVLSGGSICGSQRCENTIGSYSCLTNCEPGYQVNHAGICEDVNECANVTVCGANAYCQNLLGTYRCVCDQGFTSNADGKTCVDVDECVSLPGVCGTARCENVEGSFMCECDQAGQSYDTATKQCLSLSARAEEIPNSQTFSSGSSSSSSSAFHASVVELSPMLPPLPEARPGELRECYYNLAEQGTCILLATNTTQQECCCTLGEGWGLGCQYHTCPSAYTTEFLTLCPSGRGYVTEGPGAFSYRDVDECKRFHPEVCKNGVCVNNIPGYSCYCSSGYVYNSTLLECVDHDECEEESCVGGICVNTVGSYYCSCQPPLVLDDTQRNCVNSSDLNEDENLSVCWQHVTTDLMCQSALRGAQVTFTDCCCLYGQGWGMSCALCPTDTDAYARMCSSSRPPPLFPERYPDSETGRGRGSASPNPPPYGLDYFPVIPGRDYGPPDYDDYSPAEGSRTDFRGRPPTSFSLPDETYRRPEYSTGFYSEGDYEPPDSSQPRPPSFRIPPDPRAEIGFGVQPPPQSQPDGPPLSLAPLPGGRYEDSEDSEEDRTWRSGPPFPPFTDRSGGDGGGGGGGVPRRLYERRYESYASLRTPEDCGILHGCENGRCIRVSEGYTCDCYQGYELDMTSMTCIDVNECEDGLSLEFPCVNARCVNTDGSYRCVCRRGYVMSRRPNHCVAA